MEWDLALQMHDATVDEETRFAAEDFYPGQKVEGSVKLFRQAIWLTKPRPSFSRRMTTVRAIVEKVVLTGVRVKWIICGFSAYGPSQESVDPPPEQVQEQSLHK